MACPLAVTLRYGRSSAEEPLIIGAAIAQSGVIAPYDDGPAKAMEVAIEQINAKGGLLGKQIKIIYADTKSDIAYGATAAQDVIDKGAQMVVVTCDYDYGSAAASVADSEEFDRLFDLCRRSEIRPLRHRPQRLYHGDRRHWPGGGAGRMGLQCQRLALTAYILLDTTIAFDASFAGLFKARWMELAGADGLIGEDTLRRRRSADRQPNHPHQGAGKATRLSSC